MLVAKKYLGRKPLLALVRFAISLDILRERYTAPNGTECYEWNRHCAAYEPTTSLRPDWYYDGPSKVGKGLCDEQRQRPP